MSSDPCIFNFFILLQLPRGIPPVQLFSATNNSQLPTSPTVLQVQTFQDTLGTGQWEGRCDWGALPTCWIENHMVPKNCNYSLETLGIFTPVAREAILVALFCEHPWEQALCGGVFAHQRECLLNAKVLDVGIRVFVVCSAKHAELCKFLRWPTIQMALYLLFSIFKPLRTLGIALPDLVNRLGFSLHLSLIGYLFHWTGLCRLFRLLLGPGLLFLLLRRLYGKFLANMIYL